MHKRKGGSSEVGKFMEKLRGDEVVRPRGRERERERERERWKREQSKTLKRMTHTSNITD
jgi:hypothetical protein